MNLSTAASVFAALGQPVRIEILRILVQAGHEGLSIGSIRERLSIPPTTFSFHLAALEQAGAITSRKEGRYVFMQPNFEVINGAVGFLTENCCGGCGERVSLRKKPMARARC